MESGQGCRPADCDASYWIKWGLPLLNTGVGVLHAHKKVSEGEWCACGPVCACVCDLKGLNTSYWRVGSVCEFSASYWS